MSSPGSAACTGASSPPFTFTTPQGTVRTRPAALSDHAAVDAMHRRSSLPSRYSRYQSVRAGPNLREWSALLHPDKGEAYVAQPDADPPRIVAVSHLVRTSSPGVGELGLLVEDAWQNMGLGTALTRHVLARATCLALRSVLVMTEWSNYRMLAICRALDGRTVGMDGGIVEFALPVDPAPEHD